MHWLKIFKKKKEKRERGQIKKKESKFVPKPLGVGKKSTRLQNFLSSLFFFVPVQRVGLLSPNSAVSNGTSVG